MSSLFNRSPLWADEGEDVSGAPPSPRPRISLLTLDPSVAAPAKPAAALKPPPETLEQRNNTVDDLLDDPRTTALLDVLAEKESKRRYNAIGGGGGTFSNYADHPDAGSKPGRPAGAYQFDAVTWREMADQLQLPDFSPESQDRAAVHLLHKLQATERLMKGDVTGAVLAAGRRWDVFPRSSDGLARGNRMIPLQPILDRYEQKLNSRGGAAPQ